jgi:hypothetical protein
MVRRERMVTMNSNNDSMPERCGQCGRLRTHAVQILSRHTTSDGVVVYSECICGRLEARLYPVGNEATVVAQGGTG